MTKQANQKLPESSRRGGSGMYHCEICKVWVPSKDKHNKKHHSKQ